MASHICAPGSRRAGARVAIRGEGLERRARRRRQARRSRREDEEQCAHPIAPQHRRTDGVRRHLGVAAKALQPKVIDEAMLCHRVRRGGARGLDRQRFAGVRLVVDRHIAEDDGKLVARRLAERQRRLRRAEVADAHAAATRRPLGVHLQQARRRHAARAHALRRDRTPVLRAAKPERARRHAGRARELLERFRRRSVLLAHTKCTYSEAFGLWRLGRQRLQPHDGARPIQLVSGNRTSAGRRRMRLCGCAARTIPVMLASGSASSAMSSRLRGIARSAASHVVACVVVRGSRAVRNRFAARSASLRRGRRFLGYTSGLTYLF